MSDIPPSATPSYSSGMGGLTGKVMDAGMSSIMNLEAQIAAKLNDSSGEMSQVELIELQQMMSNYTNTISMMTNILKDLSDADAEIIRNT